MSDTPTGTPVRWDVVGVGANSLDYVYRLPAWPQPQGPDSKLRISSHSIFPGGQMATALCTCASLGLRAKYVGAIGTDENGRRIRTALAERGVDVQDVRIHEGTTGFAVILVDERAGERIVLWKRGDHLLLHPAEVPDDVLLSARLVHVDDVDQEAAIRSARIARNAGIPVTSDIDRVTDSTEELIQAVAFPIFAEHVPAAITGETDLERALRKVRRRHAGLLCVTLGARGAMLLDGDRLHHEPGFAVAAVDTTGAGDVFRGAFIYGVLRGWPPPQTVRFANAAAALSCTRAGAIAGVPVLDETLALATPNARTDA